MKKDILNIILKIDQLAVEYIMECRTYNKCTQDIPSMVLVEVVKLVVDIDRLLHELLNLVTETRKW